MPYTQAERKLSVTTALGEDVLLLCGLTGREGVSRLFQLEVLALAENRTKVPFEALIGTKSTVRMKMGEDESPAFLNGVCNGVSQGRRDEEFTTYRISLVPELWLLTRRTRCRIFQQETVPEILRKALTGIDVSYDLTGTYETRDFCVQHRETDFASVRRLMEEAGIFYFFRHGDGSHTMAVADSSSSHFLVPGRTRLACEELGGGVRDGEQIYVWEKHQDLRSGRVTLRDHTFEVPHRPLEAEEPILPVVQVGTVPRKLRVGGNDALELFEWPGQYAQRFDGVDAGGASARPTSRRCSRTPGGRRSCGRRRRPPAPSSFAEPRTPGACVRGTGSSSRSTSTPAGRTSSSRRRSRRSRRATPARETTRCASRRRSPASRKGCRSARLA